MESVLAYIEKEKQRYIDELIAFLSIPSVSTDSAYKQDMISCAAFVVEHLTHSGFQNVQQFDTEGHAIIYGDYIQDPSYPTVLIYGHYDVQPPEPFDLWVSPPFEPTIRDNYIYARGASDDKGQILCHIKSVEAFLNTKHPLKVNIKFLIEGEEEISSPNLVPFLENHKELLAADIALVSDTPMFNAETPSICTSLRGIVYTEVRIRCANGDLHSGQNGGPAPNPIMALSRMITQLKNTQNHVQIPGFYDDVRDLTPKERDYLNQLPFDPETYKKQQGIFVLEKEQNFHPYEQLWYRPTLDCNGICGGYIGEGEKTVIPATAMAKISMRLVKNQTPQKIIDAFTNFIKQITPKGYLSEIIVFPNGAPVAINPNHPAISAGLNALKSAFNKNPILQGEGGSIPILADFERVLNLPTILMGFNCPNDNIHAPNERFSLSNFQGGIRASAFFLQNLSTS